MAKRIKKGNFVEVEVNIKSRRYPKPLEPMIYCPYIPMMVTEVKAKKKKLKSNWVKVDHSSLYPITEKKNVRIRRNRNGPPRDDHEM